jgi:N utilization substance protein A
MTEPVRTCVGCGRKAPQSRLLRFVSSDGVLTPDPRRRLPGRGAYTCRVVACYEQAAQRHAFARTLRAEVAVPPGLKQVFEEV